MLPYLIFSTFAYLFIGFSLKIPLLAKVLESGGYTAVDLKDAILQIVTYNNHIDKHLWFVFFTVYCIPCEYTYSENYEIKTNAYCTSRIVYFKSICALLRNT